MDNAMDQLNKQFQDMSMSFLVTPQQAQNKEKTLYVQQKINPTEPKEMAALEARLALTYTERQHNQHIQDSTNKFKKFIDLQEDQKNKEQTKKQKKSNSSASPKQEITRETKLADYIKELEREFDERKALETKENEILEAYANKHFKPIVVVRGWLETEENRARREKEENILARKRFIEANREKVLCAVLREKINSDLKKTWNSNEIPLLAQEHDAQLLLSPFYAQRVQELKNELKKIEIERKNTRYYAKAAVAPEKNITNDEPTLPNAITAHYRLSLLKNELSKPIVQDMLTAEEKQKRQELIQKNKQRSDDASQNNYRLTEAAVQDGRAKRFSRLV